MLITLTKHVTFSCIPLPLLHKCKDSEITDYIWEKKGNGVRSRQQPGVWQTPLP